MRESVLVSQLYKQSLPGFPCVLTKSNRRLICCVQIDFVNMSLPPCPGNLKAIQHYLKTATEHDKRDPVVAYYCKCQKSSIIELFRLVLFEVQLSDSEVRCLHYQQFAFEYVSSPIGMDIMLNHPKPPEKNKLKKKISVTVTV